jgi:hypothetical protein
LVILDLQNNTNIEYIKDMEKAIFDILLKTNFLTVKSETVVD